MVNSMYLGRSRKLLARVTEGRPLEAEIEAKLGALE